DTFLNLAKQGYSAYESQQNVTGGQQYNSPHHSGQDSQIISSPNINHEEAVRNAQEQGSGGSDLFSNALSFVSGNKHQHSEPVDEESVTNAHAQAYGSGDTSNLSAHAVGGAAALQILKQVTSGGGGGSQTQIISLAMAEASKLFEKSGAGSGNKQDAVNGAAMTVMKLLVQSKFSGAIGGGNSGGLGSLLSLAQHFA
ncbi:hypothetical protein BJ912DRAFT_941150, partial [Pholiota molesta]